MYTSSNPRTVLANLWKTARLLLLLSLARRVMGLTPEEPAGHPVRGNFELRITARHFNYSALPKYCGASTGYFKCIDKGVAKCLPLSQRCRVECDNNAELCPNAGNCTGTNQYRCLSGSQPTARVLCLHRGALCDGRLHCPLGDDESPELCRSHGVDGCPAGWFACRSPGHCVPAERRCDGHRDCQQPGLDDGSDEADCPTVASNSGAPVTTAAATTAADAAAAAAGGVKCNATTGEFRCHDGSHCVASAYVCDKFPDCDDSSDEAPKTDCPADADADAAVVEKRPCRFQTDFFCRRSGVCVSPVFLCDGTADCEGGSVEDEVCPVGSHVCSTTSYWTCASGSHCVPATARCNSVPDCPDGSDEVVGCNITVTPTTKTAESVRRDDGPCVFGVCSQLCDNDRDSDSGPRCGCRRGYLPDGNASCRAEDGVPGELLVAEASGLVSRSQLMNGRQVVTAVAGLPEPPSSRMAVDAAERQLIFVDANGRLKSVGLTPSAGERDLGGGFADVADLAYDWTRRLLFYSTPGRSAVGHVGVVDVVHGWRTVVRLLDCPGALAVEPRTASVFVWLGCGRHRGLHRMHLNGRELQPVPLMTQSLSSWSFSVGDFRPARLSLDLAQSPPRIYWTDASRPWGAFSAQLDGRDVRAHAESLATNPEASLAVFEDRLYLVAADGGAVVSVDKFAAGVVAKRAEFAALDGAGIATVAVHHAVMQLPTAPLVRPVACRRCQHVCLPAGSSGGIVDNRDSFSSSFSDEEVTCLCDWRYTTDPRSGRCEERVAVAKVSPSPDTATSTGDEAQVGLIIPEPALLAGCIAGAVIFCALAICIVVVCVKRRRFFDCAEFVIRKQSIRLEGQEDPRAEKDAEANRLGSEKELMMTVNSRTPLTAVECVAA